MPNRNIETAFPLSPLQEGMLYHTIRHSGSSVYHGQCTAALEGALREELFKEAWQLAARRHQAFRTFFAWERRDPPLQVVREHVSLEWTTFDWAEASDTEQEREWLGLLEQDRTRPFDLTSAPLMRFVLVRLGSARHRVLWSLHHALADGWSGLSVLKEVIEDYEALVEGAAPDRAVPPSFATFVTWLRSRDAGAAEAYWRDGLMGLERPTPLPGAEKRRPAAESRRPGPERATIEMVLSADESSALRAASARMRVTPNTVAVGAWAVLLDRYETHGQDVVFGVTISERPAEIPGIERSMGLYLSTVPVRVRVAGDEPVSQWLRQLQSRLSDGRAHSAGGLAEIQRWSPLLSRSDLVRSLVVYESFPPEIVHPRPGTRLRMTDTTISAPSDLPLALLVYPDERVMLQLVYDPSLYAEPAAQRLLAQASRLLVELADDPDRKLRELEPLEDDVQERLLGSWSMGDGPVPEWRDVIEMFEARATETPDAIAIRTHKDSVSYGELDRTSNQIARRVLGVGLEPGSLVGIAADRSPDVIAAVIATLKAGFGYTLIDPRQPTARLSRMVAHTHITLALSKPERLPGRVFLVETAAEGLDTRLELDVADDALAYVVWTSGSTGEPNGVLVERGHLARSTAARLAYYDEPPRNFLMLSSLAVDSSVAGIYWTLCTGGTLVLPDPHAEQNLEGLSQLIEEGEVTTMLLVPSLYRAILQEVDSSRLRSLTSVIVAGEACHPSVVGLHRAGLPGLPLYNEYGPSEATVWATVSELTASPPEPPEPVTIGRPVAFVRIYVLDSELRHVPVGVPGEICIGGSTVSRGYLGRPDLTAERFVPDPSQDGHRMYRTGDRGRFLEDSRLEFLGRLDDQIKIRGFRVEPAEIERVLEAYEGIDEAAVVLSTPTMSSDPDALLAELLRRSESGIEQLLSTAMANS